MKPNKTIIATILCLICFNGAAKEGDLEQEVKISASSQEADIKNNQLIFNGPVLVTQGSIKINAAELQAFSKGDDAAKTLIATGSPATYSQIMDDGLPAQASAQEIHYELSTRTLTLIGEATLAQGGSRVTGSRIRYNIEQQKLLAESTGKGEDRVITVIQPETYKKTTNNQAKSFEEKTPQSLIDEIKNNPSSQPATEQEALLQPSKQQKETINEPIQPTSQQQENTQVNEINKTPSAKKDRSILTGEIAKLSNERETLESKLTQLITEQVSTSLTPSQLRQQKATLQAQIDKIKPQQNQLEAQLSELIPSSKQLKDISAQLSDEKINLPSLTSTLKTSAQAVSSANAIQDVKVTPTQEQQE